MGRKVIKRAATEGGNNLGDHWEDLLGAIQNRKDHEQN